MKVNIEPGSPAPEMGAPFFTYEKKVFIFLAAGAFILARAILKKKK